MRSIVCHALTRDLSKAVSSQGSQHQKGHRILHLAITFSELIVICLASICAFLFGIPEESALPSPAVRISFHFLIYLPCTKKKEKDSVQQRNKKVFHRIRNILKLTSLPFSVWSNCTWHILKGLESSDTTKHVFLWFCTIWSQDAGCGGVTTDKSTTVDICAHK